MRRFTLRPLSLLLCCTVFCGFSHHADAQLSSPTLNDIYQYLLSHYPQYNGLTYDKPEASLLASDWLLQTPNAWGTSYSEYNKSVSATPGTHLDPEFYLPSCQADDNCQGISHCMGAPFLPAQKKLCMTKAHRILYILYDNIVQANDSIDIMTYGSGGISNGAFSATLKNALTELARRTLITKHPVTVRIMEGSIDLFKSQQLSSGIGIDSLKPYLHFLTADFPAGNQLKISVANERSCQFASNCGNNNDQHDYKLNFSFSHAKLVNVDGFHLLLGGENLWGRDYLETNPIIDSNIIITGAVAKGATVYANTLWQYVSTHPGITVNYCYTYQAGKITSVCANSLPVINRALTEPNVQGMFISKLNNGVGLANDADQSEISRVYALRNAQHTIRISQQSIFSQGRGTAPLFRPQKLQPFATPLGNVLEAIIYAIYHAHTEVYITTSNTQANIKDYIDYAGPDYLYKALLALLQTHYLLTKEQSAALLGRYLHLATSSLSGDVNEPSYQHNKFWMVDDRLFYIGSHVIYPCSIQEFGVIVEDADAASQLLKTLWELEWSHAIKAHIGSLD